MDVEGSPGGAPAVGSSSTTTTTSTTSAAAATAMPSGSASMNKYYPVDRLTTFYVIVQDLLSHEWKRLQRLTPAPVDNTTLNNKRRKINDDNCTKLKISRGLNKLDTSCDDETLRLEKLLNSSDFHTNFNAFVSDVSHCSGLLFVTH